MATPVSTSSADAAQSSATFSYAQAAKGQVLPSTSPSASKPESFSWADDSADTATATEDAHSSTKSHISSSKSSESEPSSSRPPRNDDAAESLHSASSEFVMVSPPATVNDTDATAPLHSPSEHAWEGKSQSQSDHTLAEGVNEERGRTKGRSGKEKNTDEAEEKIPEKALKEAPIPAINFWQQRAQEAKAKQRATSPQTKAVASTTASLATRGSTSGSSGQDNNSSQLTNKQQSASMTGGASTTRRENTARAEVQEMKSASPPTPSGVRPSRVQKSAGMTASSNSPPSVRDEMSWPTPMSAQDEDRRKAQEKGDKVEKDRTVASAPKPHGKNEWKAVPYTPSVKFNTPMPPGRGRGGRLGLRGGRGGAHSDRASAHSQSVPTEDASSEAKGKEGNDLVPVRSNSIPPAPKQSVGTTKAPENEHAAPDSTEVDSSEHPNGDGSVPSIESSQRGSKDDLIQPSTREQGSSPPAQRNQSSDIKLKSEQTMSDTHATRRRSTAQNEPAYEGSSTTKPKRRGSQTVQGDKDRRRSMMESGTAVDKGSWIDGKNDLSTHPRERDSNRESWTGPSHRERGEGRPERGRGFKGGRGNHPQPSHYNMGQNHSGTHVPSLHTSSSHPSTKGLNSFQPQLYAPSANFTSTPRGGYRNGSRSATAPGEAAFGRYTSAYGNAYQYPFTAYMNGSYDYSGAAPINAAAYNPYVEQTLLVNEIAVQLTYYFSLENMIKDLFLRKYMDSQGFLPLTLIANFKRMKELTTDLELIKYVCLQSDEYELRVGHDGRDRLRKRVDWANWVLPMADRDPTARNDGPTQATEVQTVYSSMYGQSTSHQHTIHSYQPQGRDVHSQSFSGAASSFSPLPVNSSVNGFHSPSPTLNGKSSTGPDAGTDGETNDVQPAYSSTSRPAANQRTSEETDSHVDEQTQYLKVVVRPLSENVSSDATPTAPVANVATNEVDNVVEMEQSEDRLSRARSRQDEHIVGYATGTSELAQ